MPTTIRCLCQHGPSTPQHQIPVASVHPSARRGSVLIIVLGTLALMAVLAVIYVSVGNADRRMGQATAVHDRFDEVPDQVADYLAQVIADDVLSVTPRPGGVLQRETFDYPGADPVALSIPQLAGVPFNRWDELRFNPTGSQPIRWSGNGIDPRDASDPWLASSEPTNLTPLDDISSAPQSGPGGSALVTGLPSQAWYNNRDWLAISDFAPDGRAVNLYKLRGDLNAPSGISPGGSGNRISDDLLLYDDNLVAQSPGPQLRWDGSTADPNRPADWFTFQRGLVRATNLNYTGAPSWKDPENPHYQYADADGDGLFDSRWIELVDATNQSVQNPRSLLRQSDGFRYFIAVRAVDLSGRLNLNVASDFASAPDYLNPAGATPAELDLLRLLREEDVYEKAPIGLRGVEPPRLADGSIDVNSPQNYDLFDDQTARNVGDAAYSLLQFQRQTGVIPDRKIARTFQTGSDPFENYVTSSFPTLLASLQGTSGDGPIPGAPVDWSFSPRGRRIQFLTAEATLDGAALASVGGTLAHLNGNALGTPSLAELLTYEGLNDPSTLSPLESIIGGRYDDGSPNELARSLDVLRSNRQLSVEQRDRDDHDDIAGETMPDGITDFDAMLHHQVDARHRLTTISGARPIRSTVMLPGSSAFLASGERRFTADDLDALDLRTPITAAPLTDLASFYASSLLPERDPVPAAGQIPVEQPVDPAFSVWLDFPPGGGAGTPTKVWEVGSPEFDRRRTLFYGYRGPELALRTAAHMAVNMADMLDDIRDTNGDGTLDTPDQRPSAMTVKLDQSYGGTNALSTVMDISSTLQLPLANANKPGPKAVNVYGIEPQPFITEVASFFIYHDVPFSQGGDPEWLGLVNNCATPPTPGNPGTGAPVTIDFTRDVTNPDYLLEMVAFQLTNPFLNDPADPAAGPDLDLEGYKIEFNGHVATLPAGTMIPAGESRVFYWVRSGRANTDARFVAAGQTSAIIDTTLDPLGLGATLAPVELAFGEPADSSIFVDPLGVQPAASDPLRVYLWRPIDPQFGATDMLADRLRIETFDQIFVASTLSGNMAITNTCTTAEGAGDDTGLTVFLHASTRRPADDQLFAKQSVALPAYCMEARTRRDTNNDGQPETWNYSVAPPIGKRGTLTKANFPDNTYLFLNFASAEGQVLGLSPDFFQVGEPARNKVYTRANGELNPSLFNRSGSDFEINGASDTFGQGLPRDKTDAGNLQITDLRIELPTRLDARRLRAGDMLMPLAIGAWQELENPSAINEEDQIHPGWVALSEAIAIALDYDTPRDATRAPLMGSPYFDAGRLTPEDPGGSPPPPVGTPQREQYDADVLTGVNQSGAVYNPVLRGVLDHGHLVLDDFVPFYDGITRATPDQIERFDPTQQANALAQDVRYGLGLPAALGIIENFTAMTSDQGSLTQATPGVLNANTATQIALRSVPMLAPTASLDPTTGQREWWWRSNGINGPHGPNTDIASTLLAYRDKLPNFQPREPINLIYPVRLRFDDRLLATVISGIRETPGLRSVGELLALRMSNPRLFSNPNAPINARSRHNIDRLGIDGFGLQMAGTAPDDGTAGVDTIRYGTIPQPNNTIFPPPPGVDDGIIDDWDEKLAIVNGALASTSVRTDYVAVWFLIHGYQDSDVAQLLQDGNDDRPLVPTINRRFVMVVDRSSVTRTGDRPRIVLFREVPR